MWGPTSIAEPFTKASWTVIESDGLPQAIERALRVAKTPPVGSGSPRCLWTGCSEMRRVSTEIIEGEIQSVRAGYPADEDVEAVIRALSRCSAAAVLCWGTVFGRVGQRRGLWRWQSSMDARFAGTWTEMAPDAAEPQPALWADRGSYCRGVTRSDCVHWRAPQWSRKTPGF